MQDEEADEAVVEVKDVDEVKDAVRDEEDAAAVEDEELLVEVVEMDVVVDEVLRVHLSTSWTKVPFLRYRRLRRNLLW